MIPPDLDRFIERAFAAPDHAEARNRLDSAIIHDGSPAGPRLLRCAAVASQGSIERLQVELAMLKIDYRDVIVEGEYESREGRLVRVRDLNQPIPDEG